MRYIILLLFLFVTLQLKSQETNSSDSKGSCDLFIPDTLKKFWEENLGEYVILVIKLGEDGDIEKERINILQHMTTKKDSMAVNLILNTPPKLFNIDPEKYRNEKNCHTIAIRFGEQSIGLEYDILNLDNYLYDQLSSNDIENIELGKEFFENKLYTSALKYFQIALSNGHYQNAELHYLMYQCLTELGKPESACIYLEEAKNFDSRYKNVWRKNCK